MSKGKVLMIDKLITEANKCSNQVVASGHMCGGCHLDSYCQVTKKFNELRRYEWKEWEKAYHGIG